MSLVIARSAQVADHKSLRLATSVFFTLVLFSSQTQAVSVSARAEVDWNSLLIQVVSGNGTFDLFEGLDNLIVRNVHQDLTSNGNPRGNNSLVADDEGDLASATTTFDTLSVVTEVSGAGFSVAAVVRESLLEFDGSGRIRISVDAVASASKIFDHPWAHSSAVVFLHATSGNKFYSDSTSVAIENSDSPGEESSMKTLAVEFEFNDGESWDVWPDAGASIGSAVPIPAAILLFLPALAILGVARLDASPQKL